MNELLDFCSELTEAERDVIIDNQRQIKDILYIIASSHNVGLTINAVGGTITNVLKAQRTDYV